MRNLYESMLDTLDKKIDNVKDNKTFYLSVFAECVVKSYKKNFVVDKVYPDTNDNYVLIPIRKEAKEKLIKQVDNHPYTPVDKTFKKYTESLVDPLHDMLLKRGYSDTNKAPILHVSDYYFGTFKVGNPRNFDDPEKRIYPSVGIIIGDIHDYKNSYYILCIDLGDDKLHKELIKYIKQFA